MCLVALWVDVLPGRVPVRSTATRRGVAEPSLWLAVTVPAKQRSDRRAEIAVSPGVVVEGRTRFSDDQANGPGDQGIDHRLPVGVALDGKRAFSELGGSATCEDLGQLLSFDNSLAAAFMTRAATSETNDRDENVCEAFSA